MRTLPIIFIASLLLISGYVQAHEVAEHPASAGFLDPVNSIFYSIAIVVMICLVSMVFGSRLNNKHKKILFILILAPVLFSTIYLAGSTVYMNIVSETGGPVHWHADFEIWVCGQKVLLKGPEALDNKVGTATLHHHNEGKELDGRYRMHVEGVLAKLEEANLGHFFESTGNLLTQNSMGLFLMDGSQKRWSNGDICPNTGKPGKLKVLVNNRQIENFTEYVISPYTNVPPGDFIKIVFE